MSALTQSASMKHKDKLSFSQFYFTWRTRREFIPSRPLVHACRSPVGGAWKQPWCVPSAEAPGTHVGRAIHESSDARRRQPGWSACSLALPCTACRRSLCRTSPSCWACHGPFPWTTSSSLPCRIRKAWPSGSLRVSYPPSIAAWAAWLACTCSKQEQREGKSTCRTFFKERYWQNGRVKGSVRACVDSVRAPWPSENGRQSARMHVLIVLTTVVMAANWTPWKRSRRVAASVSSAWTSSQHLSFRCQKSGQIVSLLWNTADALNQRKISLEKRLRMSKNYYAVLGLTRSADDAGIKKASVKRRHWLLPLRLRSLY